MTRTSSKAPGGRERAEVSMRSVVKLSAMTTVVAGLLVGVSSAARAATVEVNVPFPFIVQGQTLPAGQYRIEREGADLVVIRGEKGNKTDVFALTVPAAGQDPVGDQPVLTFTRHETQYRLADVWDSEG